MLPQQPEVLINTGLFRSAPIDLIERAIRMTLDEDGTIAEISLALLADSEMQELNLRHLGKDSTTDVISFSLGGEGLVVGDVYVGFEQAIRQADELGIEVGEELARLAIHGTLHVLGYDHPEGPERSKSPMFQVQEQLLRNLLGSEVNDT
jgi:probable rRNA maturation factor|tara:strand:+ start:91 stop:540 length:450 start_codon:yes stop_codon:yes gene_type:complete